ncbi:MAG: T9SS type B sorting domain-containing protein [Bacteroidia bacterium]
MKFIFGILTLFLTVHFSYAQKEASVWFFGNQAGLVFRNDTVIPRLENQMISDEGCATIADKNGKLLFYTDGIKVWNRNNQKMPNGTELAGDSSATQSAVIVPFINDSTKYYIFTIDREGNKKGFQYSVVDMQSEFGLGNVIVKNHKLENWVSEKLTAVLHRNRKDIWVIVHRWNSRKFAAYLVTQNGVNPVPVVSETGSYHGGNMYNSIGYLKASPDGRKLASVIHAVDGECQVFDFDNSTGLISNPYKLTGLKKPYGVEFSANGTYLYTGDFVGPSRIYQYHLYKDDSNKINSSRILLATINAGEGIGAYQMGPDRKIYITHYNKSKLSIIHDPDKGGSKCNFELEAIDLKQKNAMLGLPNFVQSLFTYEVETDFDFDTVCFGRPTFFKERSNASPYVWKWNFGDPLGDEANYADQQNPVYTYKSPGNYNVTLTTTVAGYDYSVTKTVSVLNNPPMELGEDAIYCLGDTILLSGGNTKGQKYFWNTGDSAQQIKVYETGIYWVSAWTGKCVRTDAIYLTFVNTDYFGLGNDTIICERGQLWLKGNLPDAQYTWHNGSTDDSIKVTHTGWYKLRAKVGHCEVADSQYVLVYPEPKANIGIDEPLCEYDEKLLDAGSFGMNYIWSTGETTRQINAMKRGKYWVNIYSGECFSTDTIDLSACAPVTYIPNVFTPNNDGMNDEFRIVGKDMNRSQLLIYNRWGQCIFESNDIWKGWDGKWLGETCSNDSYFWIFRYNSVLHPNEDFKVLNGTVNLLR